MRLQMMVICDKIREADEIGDQRGVWFIAPFDLQSRLVLHLNSLYFLSKKEGNLKASRMSIYAMQI